MNKSIRIAYWLMPNLNPEIDQLPDSVEVYYDVYYEGRPMRRKISLPIELTKDVVKFFTKHITEIAASERRTEDIL